MSVIPGIVVDLDGTLALTSPDGDYRNCPVNERLLETLRGYHAAGTQIVVDTARNMRTYQGSVGMLNAHTLPVILEWLRRHEVPFDEIHVGKPWPGRGGVYVDDRALRPAEFVTTSPGEIEALLRGDPR